MYVLWCSHGINRHEPVDGSSDYFAYKFCADTYRVGLSVEIYYICFPNLVINHWESCNIGRFSALCIIQRDFPVDGCDIWMHFYTRYVGFLYRTGFWENSRITVWSLFIIWHLV